MTSKFFWKFLTGLAVCFATPLVFLVQRPFERMSNAEPIPYAEEEEIEGGTAAYPAAELMRHGSSDYGRQIYTREGCAYCHTQMVRPTYAGPDMWRSGWGGRPDGLARETRAEDYTQELVAPLGYQRIGPDLSNIGHRITDRALLHRHLYEPRALERESGMPAYTHLYKESPFGKGVEPTSEAEALVDYLLSLKKDQQLPASLVNAN